MAMITLISLWGSPTFTFPKVTYERLRRRPLVPAELSTRSRVVLRGPFHVRPFAYRPLLSSFAEVAFIAEGRGLGAFWEEVEGSRYQGLSLHFKPSPMVEWQLGVYEAAEAVVQGRESSGFKVGVVVYDHQRFAFSAHYYHSLVGSTAGRATFGLFTQSMDGDEALSLRVRTFPTLVESQQEVRVEKGFFNNTITLSLSAEGHVNGRALWEALEELSRRRDAAQFTLYGGVGLNFSAGQNRFSLSFEAGRPPGPSGKQWTVKAGLSAYSDP